MHPTFSFVRRFYRGKLTMYHLRDAFRNDSTVLETAVTVIFFPLLYSIDSDLYHHLVGGEVVVDGGGDSNMKVLTSCIVSWISNWFATDITDITAISRLIDVFLVSHPTTPIYCAIALLIYYRDVIVLLPNIHDMVHCVPLFQLDKCNADNDTNSSLEAIEQIISMTLIYMYVCLSVTVVMKDRFIF
jgi:hypothetical protein